jgi:hypothetical protein
MTIDWRRVLAENMQRIVGAAQQAAHAKDPVCVLVDIDDARSGKVAPGLQALAAGTKLQGAVPVNDPEGRRRFVCIPVGYARLLELLEQHEDVGELRKRIKVGGTLVLWVLCFDGDDRICLDIHVTSPGHN